MRRLGKYGAFATTAAQQALTQKGAMLGRFAFYLILLLVFSRLWMVAYAHPIHRESNPVDMLWYLAITEWIVLSLPMIYLDFEEDVRSGNLAYLMCRPASYLWMRIFEGFGTLVVRLAVLGIAGIVCARVLSGAWPSHPAGLWLAIPLGVVSGIVGMIFQAAIGLSAFWLQDASPVYWVWQKSTFILGGLILPLSIYPAWLRRAAMMTPFSSLLYGPAHAAIEADPSLALRTLMLLVLWGLIALVFLEALYRRGQKFLNINGG